MSRWLRPGGPSHAYNQGRHVWIWDFALRVVRSVADWRPRGFTIRCAFRLPLLNPRMRTPKFSVGSSGSTSRTPNMILDFQRTDINVINIPKPVLRALITPRQLLEGPTFGLRLINRASCAGPEKVFPIGRYFWREFICRRVDRCAQILCLRPLSITVVTDE